MPTVITDERVVYNSIIDLANEPIAYRVALPGFIVGDDGKTYQITIYTDGGTEAFALFEINKTAGTRTISYVLSEAALEAAVTAKSGIAAPGASSPKIVGILAPRNYFLVAQSGLSVSTYTIFSLWKIDSSGEPECLTATSYAHGSDSSKVLDYPDVGISNNKTEDDPIVIIYSGDLSGGLAIFMRAWRLPSINGIIAKNGVMHTGVETGYNNVPAQGSYSDNWLGRSMSQFGGVTTRRATNYFAILPFNGRTRCYFYNGPGDTVTPTVGSFSEVATATYGNQFFGYIDLGVVEYSDTTTWAPDFNPKVDSSLLKWTDNFTDYLPFMLWNADPSSADSDGYGDFAPGGTIQKISRNRWMVNFSASLSENQFSGSSYSMMGRWMSFTYDTKTGYFRLVTRGTYTPGTEAAYNKTTLGTYRSYATYTMYDETEKRVYFSLYNTINTGAGGGFGMVDALIDIDLTGEPGFLTETDATYKDFVDRYTD